MVDTTTLSNKDLERRNFESTSDDRIARIVSVSKDNYQVTANNTYYLLVETKNLKTSAIVNSYINTGNTGVIDGDSINTYYNTLKKYYSDTYLRTYVLLESNTPFLDDVCCVEAVRQDDLAFIIRKYNLSELSDIRAIDSKFGCVELNGLNEYLYSESNASIDLTGSFSYSTWINAKNIGASQFVASAWDEFQDNRSWYLLIESNGRVELLLCEDGTAGTRVSVKSNSTINFDVWMMLTSVYDSAGNVKLYANDVEIGDSAVAINEIHASGERLYLGAKQFNDITTTFYKGQMATTALYNSALDADAISNLYKLGRKYDMRAEKNATNLVFYSQLGRDFDANTLNGVDKIANQEIVYQNIDASNVTY